MPYGNMMAGQPMSTYGNMMPSQPAMPSYGYMMGARPSYGAPMGAQPYRPQYPKPLGCGYSGSPCGGNPRPWNPQPQPGGCSSTGCGSSAPEPQPWQPQPEPEAPQQPHIPDMSAPTPPQPQPWTRNYTPLQGGRCFSQCRKRCRIPSLSA